MKKEKKSDIKLSKNERTIKSKAQHDEVWEQLLAIDSNISEIYPKALAVSNNSYVHVIKLWDGIIMMANEIYLKKLYYPAKHFDEREITLLNVCHDGRCEVELNTNEYIYMAPGVFNFVNSRPKTDYYYPSGLYKGIEISFDLVDLKKKMPEALLDFGIDYELIKNYNKSGNFLSQLPNDLLEEEKQLYEMIASGNEPLTAIRFATLQFLYHVFNSDMKEMEFGVMVSKGYRRIITEAEQMLMEDLKKKYTVEDISERFGISQSTFKKYFMAVYGRPVSKYVREKRVEMAKDLLANSNMSVGEIAETCGYEHQGKFGTVFKAFTGVSPLEYRRLNVKL